MLRMPNKLVAGASLVKNQRGLLLLTAGVLFILALLSKTSVLYRGVLATDPVEQLQSEIDELEKLKRMSEEATSNLEHNVRDLNSKINHAQAGINDANAQSQALAASILEREDSLALQYTILNERVAIHYKRLRTYNPIMIIFANSDLSNLTKDLTYNSRVQNQDTELINSIAQDIFQLEEDKLALEERKKQLAALQVQLDEQKKFFEGEIAGAKEYQQTLGSQIAELSARQQAIIDSRSGGGFTFTLGSGELADEYLSSARGFRESAPAGHFAIFSFGGYSHRNGMSQYGARGRAEAGQSVEEILKAYYPNATLRKDYPVMESILVDGHGSMPFEDQYLHGIYEVPNSWHINVLKAQAIAARTYAIRRTNRGANSICTTQACQVFKNERKGGAWEQAVNETKGWVLVEGGDEPALTQYSSTSGGFLRTSGWDTTDGSGGSDFIDKAYEKKGNSPWLEKAWWREGYTNSGDTCGRSNPWLSPEEMADIVNAAIALRTGGVNTERITPATTSCWGGDPYSMAELRELVKEHGGISLATSVSVSQGNGVTTNVTINGVSMSGSEFRKALNLRASGYIRIPQSSSTFGDPFFTVVKK